MLGTVVSLEADQYQLGMTVADKAREFVGCEYDELLASAPCGHLTIEADAGLDESAILAEFTRRTGCIAHFSARSLGVNTAAQFIQSVCARLVAEAALPYVSLPVEASEDGAFLLKLLKAAAQKIAPDRLLLAIDALDEVDVSTHPPGANILFLPGHAGERAAFATSKIADAMQASLSEHCATKYEEQLPVVAHTPARMQLFVRALQVLNILDPERRRTDPSYW